MTSGPVLAKFGGELVETPERLDAVGKALAALAATGPLVVVHGGGREIDAELARRGVPSRRSTVCASPMPPRWKRWSLSWVAPSIHASSRT